MTKSLKIIIILTLVFSMSFLVSGCVDKTKPTSTAMITVEPTSGSPASQIKIKGVGFKPNEEIDVLFVLEPMMKIGLGTTKVDVIKADDKGNFTAEAGIPINAKPGKYTIEAIGNKDSEAKTTVEVTPKKK